MKEIEYSNQFKKDIKRCQKRGNDTEKLKQVIELIVNDKPLSPKHRPHVLSGNYSDYWECHISPDWLLIYKIKETSVFFYRTGTHADLFK